MMNKKISLLVLILMIFFILSGCQLAVLDGAMNKNKDKLIGAYISFEHVDLFDIEGYINDINFAGGEIKIDETTPNYEGRMYATRKDEVETTTKGEKYTQTSFIFEEVEGVGILSPTITDPLNDNLTCTTFLSEDGFCDTYYNSISGDNEDGLELEGTLYASFVALNKGIYVNPVYQSSDGRVYLVTGQGFSALEDNGEGEVYSQTISDKVTVSENVIGKSYSVSVKVSIKTMNPTKSVTIIQMDKNSGIVKKTEYSPDEVPENLSPEKATEYIIVESQKLTSDKQQKIERTVFSKNDDSLWYFRNKDNKVYVKAYTEILWDGVEE